MATTSIPHMYYSEDSEEEGKKEHAPETEITHSENSVNESKIDKKKLLF